MDVGMNAPRHMVTREAAHATLQRWYARHQCELIDTVLFGSQRYSAAIAAIGREDTDVDYSDKLALACELIRRDTPGFAADICRTAQLAERAERLRPWLNRVRGASGEVASQGSGR